MIMILSQFINGMRSSSKNSRLGITNVLQGNTVDEKILHQLISSFFPSISPGFIHPRWCRISSINRMFSEKKILDGIHLLPIPHNSGPSKNPIGTAPPLQTSRVHLHPTTLNPFRKISNLCETLKLSKSFTKSGSNPKESLS